MGSITQAPGKPEDKPFPWLLFGAGGLLVVILIGAGLHQAPPSSAPSATGLSRDFTTKALETNRDLIFRAYFARLGLSMEGPGYKIPNDVGEIATTGISATSPTTALVTFAAIFTTNKPPDNKLVGEVQFRLFDDGWRLERDTLTAGAP